MDQKAYKVSTGELVGIVTKVQIGDKPIFTLEWIPRREMNVVTGPTIEGVIDAASEEVEKGMDWMWYDHLGGDG